MTTITMSEWMAAFEAAQAKRPGDDGMTTQELADASDPPVSYGIMRKRVRMLSKAGKLIVGKSMREAMDGRRMQLPVYRLKPEA